MKTYPFECQVNELMAEIDLLNGAKNALSQDKSSLLTQIATITDINKQTNVSTAQLLVVHILVILHIYTYIHTSFRHPSRARRPR